jgi:hypothetical protein
MPISKINPNSLAANSVTSAAIANGAIAISGVTDLQTTLDAKLDDTDVGVSVQAYDADTAKLDVAQSFTAVQTMGKALQETKVAIAASEIDLALGNYFTKTISGATTFTITNVASSGTVSAFVLELTNGGSDTVTFFSGVTWAAATPPTLTASGVDTLAFFTHDGGTTWRGFVLGLGMAAA